MLIRCKTIRVFSSVGLERYLDRENIAELMPLYVAVKFFPERISNEIRDKILSCSLNRILYLDSLNLDMSLYEN